MSQNWFNGLSQTQIILISIIGAIAGIIFAIYYTREFFKKPGYYSMLYAKGVVIAGVIGLIIELFFKDWTGVKICLLIIFVGGGLFGLQAFAWKQWEDRKKKG